MLKLRKLTILLILILTILSSANAFAGNYLDTTRWEWCYSTDEYGIFIDNQTIKYYNGIAEYWECNYYPRSCTSHNCGEHYHYYLSSINFRNNTIATKGIIVRDFNGKVLFSDYRPSYGLRFEPIAPQSVGEVTANKVRSMLQRKYSN